MGWFSNLRRSAISVSSASGPEADVSTVQQARVRARRRLIGAAVLVVVGVIGFPLVFETQPRPIPVDIPIEIPRKEGLPPLAMPAAKTPAQASAPASALAVAPTPTAPIAATANATSSVQPVPVPVPVPVAPALIEEVIAPNRAPAAVSSLPVPTTAPTLKAAERPASAAVAAASTPAKVAVKPPAATFDGDRAKALLESKPTTAAEAPKAEASKESGRFVVQVGAFSENEAARTTRLKVEKLGLKTYVQVAETPAGKRIRVRVGPYVTKEEAEQAKTKLTAGGFTAVLLTL